MKKVFVFLLVCFLLIGIVSAQDGWGDYRVVDENLTDGEDPDDEDVVDDPIGGEDPAIAVGVADDNAAPDPDDEELPGLGSDTNAGETASSSGESSIVKTQNFWYAIYVSIGALLIFFLLLFLLLRKPQNRWKKR